MSAEYFSARSSDYSRYRPHYPAEWFDWLAPQCAEQSLAWDCACGSGQATEELARRFKEVIATDASADQRRNAPLLPNVEWRLASGEASGLEDGRVDLVTVAQALHWLDLPRFWQECRRVSKPEGIIAVWGYGIASLIHQSTNQIFKDFYHMVVGEYWPKERRMVEEGYVGIDFPFQEIPVPLFEMVQSWDVEHLAGYCSSWSATDRYRKATGYDPIPELREKLNRELGSAATEIRWPFFAKVGRLFHVEQNAEEEN
jgi:SAM-dependent methyltransferase